MVYHPFLGPVGPDGITPVGAIYAMRAQAQAQAEALTRAAYAAARAEQEAKDRMRGSGAICEIDCRSAEGSDSTCEVPAIGRCGTCHRTFCESHAGVDRSEQIAFTPIMAMHSLAECWGCQDREFGRRVERARVEIAEAEAARRAAQELRERQRRDHDRLVAVWEAANDWPNARREISRLSTRIGKLRQRRPASRSSLVGAAVVGLIDLVAILAMCAGAVADNNRLGALGVLALLAMVLPTILAVVAIVRWLRQQLRDTYVRERDILMEVRGCGDPSCVNCRNAPYVGAEFPVG
jgi:hypothetical protein